MSTPATWKDIERSKQRRDRNDRFHSNQLSRSQYSSRDQYRQPAHYHLPSPPVQQPSNNWRSEPMWSQGNPGNSGYIDFASDSFALSNQAPIQQQQQQYMMPSVHQYRQEHPMMIPASQEFIDYTISPTNIVLFHGKHFMSTLYKSPMKIEDFMYPSVEHYYQACKLYTLGGTEMALRMNGVHEPYQCKSAVRTILNSINVPKQKIEGWRRAEAPEILVHGNLYKFAQNGELREKLLSTGDALLVHSFDKDDLYAIGMNEETTKKWSLDNNGKHIQVPRFFLKEYFVQSDRLPTYLGKGKNLLGVILMMIREAFRPERGRADPKIVELLHSLRF